MTRIGVEFHVIKNSCKSERFLHQNRNPKPETLKTPSTKAYTLNPKPSTLKSEEGPLKRGGYGLGLRGN